MRTLIIVLLILSSQLAFSQNLSKQLDQFLKNQANTIVDDKKDAIKQEVSPQTEQKTLPEKDNAEENTAIADSLPLKTVNDSLPKISAIDSLTKETQQTIDIAQIIDTVGFAKQEWEAKTHVTTQNQPEEYWQKKYYLSEINKYSKFHILDSSINVFGWHPYWMGNAYKNYNFSLLTQIAYFSYETNPVTGDYKTIHNWQTTALVDSAKKYACQVLLTVTNFGTKNNEIFLTNAQNQQKRMIENLISLLRERDADGVCIDFEEIPTKMRNNFTNFIIDLSRNLKSAEKKYLLSIALPIKDFRQVFDIKSMSDFVDLFVIMGYEFYGKYSKVAGPVAPLSSGDIWWEYNVEGSILEYKVAGIPSEKLLLGVPYYGVEWQTRNLTFPSKSLKFSGYYTYKSIRQKFNDINAKIDPNSGSAYHVYRNRDNKYYQLWHEDTSTLGAKYDMVKKYALGGVGIWALGYDNGYSETWELLARKFALSPELAAAVLEARAEKKERKKVFKKVMKLAKKAAKNPMSVLQSPGPLIKVFGAMFGVSVVGLLLVLKMGKKMKKTAMVGAKGGLIALFFAMVLIVTKMLKFIEMNELLLIVLGLVIGGGVLFALSYKYIKRAKDLP